MLLEYSSKFRKNKIRTMEVERGLEQFGIRLILGFAQSQSNNIYIYVKCLILYNLERKKTNKCNWSFGHQFQHLLELNGFWEGHAVCLLFFL